MDTLFIPMWKFTNKSVSYSILNKCSLTSHYLNYFIGKYHIVPTLPDTGRGAVCFFLQITWYIGVPAFLSLQLLFQ